MASRDYQYLSETTARCEALAAEAAGDRAVKLLPLLAERGSTIWRRRCQPVHCVHG